MFERLFASVQLGLGTMVLFAPLFEGHFRICNSFETFMAGILMLLTIFLSAWLFFIVLVS